MEQPCLHCGAHARDFTPRQQAVIECLFAGMHDREMCARLGISRNSLRQRINRIARKLGCFGDRRFNTRVRIVWLLHQRRRAGASASQ